MKVFTVHSKKHNIHNNNFILIPEGFCLKAFVFTIFWSIYHKIWWLASFILIVNSFLYWAGSNSIMSPYSIYIFNLSLNLGLGLFGYDFYRLNLKHKNYHFVDVVTGENMDKAHFRVLEKLARNSNMVNFN